MLITTTLEEQVEIGMKGVDKTLNSIIDSDVVTLYDASGHILDSGGKRVRPQLAILAYLATDGQDVESVSPLAAAVELVHTATLVHDDINDHSELRRGRPAVHSIWGRTFALLTGDYLFAKVFALMAPYGADYNVVMADACVALVEGETIQAIAAKKGEMNEEVYKQIIERKTASLFEAATIMGAKFSGSDDETVEHLRKYGRYLGMAFQVVDDILDLIGDPEKMGKPKGLDLEQNRGVAMTTNGNGNGNVMYADGGDYRNGAIGGDGMSKMPHEVVQDIAEKLEGTNAIELAKLQAQNLGERARAELMHLPPSPARDDLEHFIDLVLNRDS